MADQNPTTPEQIAELIGAMDQLLDDMGPQGMCVSPYAKAKARVAMQPFITIDHAAEYYMPLWQAQRVVQEHDR